jgi:hypothetical protein
MCAPNIARLSIFQTDTTKRGATFVQQAICIIDIDIACGLYTIISCPQNLGKRMNVLACRSF